MGILADCLDLGRDAEAWTRLLAESVADLVHARAVIATQMHGLQRGETPVRLTGARVGFEASSQQRWDEYVSRTPLHRKPEYPYLVDGSDPAVLVTRDRVWRDADWSRSRTFNEGHRPCDVDDYLLSLVRRGPVVSTLYVHGELGGDPLGPRAERLVGLLHRQILRNLGTRLAIAGERDASGLGERRREVLELLLTGMPEKQIAAVLCRSPATVHEHALAIYRHFGVSSRPQLMALLLGGGPVPSAPPSLALR